MLILSSYLKNASLQDLLLCYCILLSVYCSVSVYPDSIIALLYFEQNRLHESQCKTPGGNPALAKTENKNKNRKPETLVGADLVSCGVKFLGIIESRCLYYYIQAKHTSRSNWCCIIFTNEHCGPISLLKLLWICFPIRGDHVNFCSLLQCLQQMQKSEASKSLQMSSGLLYLLHLHLLFLSRTSRWLTEGTQNKISPMQALVGSRPS